MLAKLRDEPKETPEHMTYQQEWQRLKRAANQRFNFYEAFRCIAYCLNLFHLTNNMITINLEKKTQTKYTHIDMIDSVLGKAIADKLLTTKEENVLYFTVSRINATTC